MHLKDINSRNTGTSEGPAITCKQIIPATALEKADRELHNALITQDPDRVEHACSLWNNAYNIHNNLYKVTTE